MEMLILTALAGAAMLPAYIVTLRLAGVPLGTACAEAVRAVGGGLLLALLIWLTLMGADVLGAL